VGSVSENFRLEFELIRQMALLHIRSTLEDLLRRLDEERPEAPPVCEPYSVDNDANDRERTAAAEERLSQ